MFVAAQGNRRRHSLIVLRYSPCRSFPLVVANWTASSEMYIVKWGRRVRPVAYMRCRRGSGTRILGKEGLHRQMLVAMN